MASPSIFTRFQNTQSLRWALCFAAWGIVFSLSYLSPTAYAQNNQFCEQVVEAVDVVLFPLPLQDSALQERMEERVRLTLTTLNFQRTSAPGFIPDSLFQKIVRNYYGNYCARRQAYRGLLVPRLDMPDTYEVRGLHLLSNQNGSADMPQAILHLHRDGTLLDVSIQTSADREKRREELADTVRNRLGERGVEVLQLVNNLEKAYNRGTQQGDIDERLRAVLPDSVEVQVSNLSQSGQIRPRPARLADAYRSALRRRVVDLRNGDPEVTFELIHVYPHLEADGRVNNGIFHVTLVQHWMFDDPPGYLDSDYIALDIMYGNEPAIDVRRAGRWGFTLATKPAGATVHRVDLEPARFKTPFTFENIASQNHYVEIADLWYEVEDTESRVIQIPWPEDQGTVQPDTVRLRHLPGNLRLQITPDRSGYSISINEKTWESYTQGSILEIDTDDLLDAQGRIAREQDPIPLDSMRYLNLRVTSTLYDTAEVRVALHSPDVHTESIELNRLQGELTISSVPDSSDFQVTSSALPGQAWDGMTTNTVLLDVTGTASDKDRPPYRIDVTNDVFYATSELADAYKLHIPDVDSAHVVYGVPTERTIELIPFYVQDQSKGKGFMDVRLQREEEILTVNYDLIDQDDRNRKFGVQLYVWDRQDNSTMRVQSDEIVCATEVACTGKGLRPGSYAFNWDLSPWETSFDSGDSAPLLVVKRAGVKWPLVLIPAAAGVAAAYIFPRTGSDDSGTFLPPPRPDDF